MSLNSFSTRPVPSVSRCCWVMDLAEWLWTMGWAIWHMIFPYRGIGIHSQDINIQGTPCFWSIARMFLSVDNVLVKGTGQLSTSECVRDDEHLCHWSLRRSLCQWFSETDCICNNEAKKWMRCSQHLTVLRYTVYQYAIWGWIIFFWGPNPFTSWDPCHFSNQLLGNRTPCINIHFQTVFWSSHWNWEFPSCAPFRQDVEKKHGKIAQWDVSSISDTCLLNLQRKSYVALPWTSPCM